MKTKTLARLLLAFTLASGVAASTVIFTTTEATAKVTKKKKKKSSRPAIPSNYTKFKCKLGSSPVTVYLDLSNVEQDRSEIVDGFYYYGNSKSDKRKLSGALSITNGDYSGMFTETNASGKEIAKWIIEQAVMNMNDMNGNEEWEMEGFRVTTDGKESKIVIYNF